MRVRQKDVFFRRTIFKSQKSHTHRFRLGLEVEQGARNMREVNLPFNGALLECDLVIMEFI